jgi:O-antigen ligase
MIVHDPLLGVGLGQFKAMVDQYQNDETEIASMAHNTYIEVAAEMGLPIFGVWCVMIGSCLGILRKAGRRAREARVRLIRAAALGIEAGLVGALFCIAFISAEFEKGLWLFIFLSITIYSMSLRCRVRRKLRPLIGITPESDIPDGIDYCPGSAVKQLS